MPTTTIEVKGLDGVLAMLKALPPELVSKKGGVVLASLRKGANVIKKEWKEQVQRILDEPNLGGADYKSTGTYQKAISVARVRKPQKFGADEAVRVRVKSLVYPDGDLVSEIAGILESGSETMAAKAPMRKAFDAKSGEALDAVVKALNDGIAKVIKKLDSTAKP